tara:strand:- start:3514 stop:4155 length:642 start_codon:yes stop_codon:yes gene_type:complete
MHTKNNSSKIICFGTKDFNNSLRELKDDLSFDLVFSDILTNEISSLKCDTIVIDSDILDNQEILRFINNSKDKSKLLIKNSKNYKNLVYTDFIKRPINIYELKNKLVELNSKKKFLENSSIRIKEYVLDKNEKKLKKNDKFIILTDKEIDLLEILYTYKKSMSKKNILTKIWKYAPEADTHTVETHIYRLRKKIFSEFHDDNLIANNDDGYKI